MEDSIDEYLNTIAVALRKIESGCYKRWAEPDFLAWLEQGEEWLSEGYKKFGASSQATTQEHKTE